MRITDGWVGQLLSFAAEPANRARLLRKGGWLWLVLGALLLGPLVSRADALWATRLPQGQLLTSAPAGRPAAPAAVTWSAFVPVGWVITAQTTVTVTAESPDGLESSTAAYATSTDGGATWTPWSVANLTVSGAISTSQQFVITALALPDSATFDQIRFQITDANGVLATSAGFTLAWDTTPPHSTVTSPAAGAVLRLAPRIAGTAADDTSGVSQVALSLRAAATGLYWTGVGWGAAESWLPATWTGAWVYEGAQPAWADGATYLIRSRAVDLAGNVESPGGSVSFTYDITPPAVTLLTPNGGELWVGGRVYTVTWSATDAVGLASQPITLSVSYDGGGSWAVLTSALTHSGSFAWTTPTLDSNRVMLEVTAVDRAGNIGGDWNNTPFTISSSPPGAPVNLQASPGVWTNAASFTLTWSNPAGVAAITGAWYKLDAPPVGPADGIFITATNWIAGIKPTTDGIHPIYLWLQDQLGRADYTRTAMTVLYLDRTAPAPPFALQGTPARAWTNVNRFTERWTNSPDQSGIVGAYYRINRPGLFPTDGIFVSTTNVINNIEVPADGKHDLYIWLLDAAGNVNQDNRNVDPQVFWFDSTSPVSAATVAPAPADNGWYNTPVTIRFSAVDGPGGSGVEAVLNRLDGNAWQSAAELSVTAEGIHTVAYYARDLAGNTETIRSLSVNLDFSPPTVTLVPARPPQASGWYTAPVTFTLLVTDTLSQSTGYYRLDAGPWQTATQFQVATNGSHQIDFYGQDAAGNRTAIQSAQAKLDNIAPATAYSIDGVQGQNGWFTSPLTIRLVPTDSGSGVALTAYRINDAAWQTGTQFQLTTNGLYTLVFYSVDVAGNVEVSYPVQVKLDTAAPSSPIAIQTTPTGWNRVNRFNIQWANPTDLSGIAGVYYRLDTEPTASDDGTFSPLTNRLDNLTVPAEGVHRLYLWLRDNAGNADYLNRAEAPLLRYDATPPLTTAQITGEAGLEDWFLTGVTVTLAATDAESGVSSTRFALDGGPWLVGTSLAITVSDKHILQYTSEDLAGNVEPIRQLTVRIDPDAPAAPINLRAAPAGWQHFNDFRLTWQSPLDLSGVAGVYVRTDRPPLGPTDGVYYPADEVLTGLQVWGEGKHDVYVWLRDHAGNSNQASAVALPSALWYDETPPITVVTLTGRLGLNNWYLGPVTFGMASEDTGSGVAETLWRLNDGAWTAGTAFSITVDGRYQAQIASADVAGNGETPLVYDIAIDSQPPVVQMASLSHYQALSHFEVRWTGTDGASGSGLSDFDLQVRDGLTGDWQDWLNNTNLTSVTFSGQRGHRYAFRVRARDRAGNIQKYTDGNAYTVVESVRNGSFDTGNFTDWLTSGLLRKAVVPTDGPGGASILAARLGSPEYGPSIEEPGQVPVGSATISQTVTVPATGQVTRPTLSFSYRVFSYDVLYSERLKRFIDTFEVSVYDPAGGGSPELLLRTGNITNRYGVLYDSGWQFAALDLQPYAGRTVQLIFASYNREDNLFNTWSFVDNVQVQGWPYTERHYLPLLMSDQVSGISRQASATPDNRHLSTDNLLR